MANGGYRDHLVEHAAFVDIDLQIVYRPAHDQGIHPATRRWAVERTFGQLMFHRRRLARDYETPRASARRP